MTRPKILYRYVGHTLEKHKITEYCFPQLEAFDRFGQLWRCRVRGDHDHYGYALGKEAKAEEIESTKIELVRLQGWLTVLLGEKS